MCWPEQEKAEEAGIPDPQGIKLTNIETGSENIKPNNQGKKKMCGGAPNIKPLATLNYLTYFYYSGGTEYWVQSSKLKNQKSKIKNQKIKNQKIKNQKIKKSKSKIKNQKSKIKNPKSKIQNTEY
jgi:hypothetical protein